MSKLYIFAIGGSGSRVLRSLTMLLASGIKTDYEIVPMVIDPDFSNGDLIRTVDIMRLYQSIHDSLIFNNNEKNEFFKNPISSLNGDGIFLLPLIGTSGISFENFINLGTMSLENQAMMRMLFSNENLSSDMNVGFKGNPNIGSIVLNQFIESKEFGSFSTNFVNGDKVFIISSIFGGTGASGFPLLLKNMRTNSNTALASAPIGAVSLLPYFNLKADKKSAIQADSFITKAKAALNYYEKNVTGNGTLDDMYYLGDDFSAAGYDNCDGGGNQQNNAHLIEMLAALSIIDFAQKDPQLGERKITNFHEFGLEEEPQESVVFADFGQQTINIFRKPLSMFVILNSYLEYSFGDDRLPKPFEFTSEQPQLSLLFKTDSAIVLDHIRGEFIPESIGENANCRFPMRTVLCIDKVNSGHNGTGSGRYEPFGNASPAFMYNQKLVGPKYNEYVPNLKWIQSNSVNEQRIKCYIESLFLMIRAKVVQEGASIQQTQIKWFYPISMSANKKGAFERLWTSAYKKYFNPTGAPIAITESIAPYSFFQKTRSDVTDIVTIDIGGGTTDIVVADVNGVKSIASMRFAADAIFGNSLVSVQNGELNGIIRLCRDEFIMKLEGEKQLQDMLIQKTANNYGNSSEVASFLFSLADNEKIKNKAMSDFVDFNAYLMGNESLKIVFFIFYTSIIYYLAHLMKAKNLGVPANIAFSGNGSKVVTVLSPNKSSLGKLTRCIFKAINNSSDIGEIKLILNSENPKEATCKGGLFLSHEPVDIDTMKSILIGVSKEVLGNAQTYADAEGMYANVVNDVQEYIDFIAFKLSNYISLKNEFGIDKQYLDLAAKCFNENLLTYVEKGVRLKLETKDVGEDDKLEEPLFFYPIIGVLNDLSNRICGDK